MKWNKALIRCLDWHDHRLCRCRGKVTMCTAHLMSLGKMPQLTTHYIVLCGEMEMVSSVSPFWLLLSCPSSIQPTLEHKHQLNKEILMEELLHNRNDITKPRKCDWNSIIASYCLYNRTCIVMPFLVYHLCPEVSSSLISYSISANDIFGPLETLSYLGGGACLHGFACGKGMRCSCFACEDPYLMRQKLQQVFSTCGITMVLAVSVTWVGTIPDFTNRGRPEFAYELGTKDWS